MGRVAQAPAEDVITPPARTRARRGEGERLRDEILVAAARVLAESGSEQAMSIRAVADAAGVTPPSIYMHFADKTDLVYAVCERNFTELDAYVESQLAGVDDPSERLALRGRAYIGFGLDHAEQYRVLFMTTEFPEHYTPEKMSEMAGYQHLVDNVRECMHAGTIATDDPEVVSVGLWALVHGITSLLVSRPSFPWPPVDTLVDHVLATYASGLSRQ
ncbi:MAG: TetR/AcrR family transcriptional regulator [Actinobacteria bacterium]|nr:TetR/AcrR family transcriptional regulator [Actinomycetota bacterium]